VSLLGKEEVTNQSIPVLDVDAPYNSIGFTNSYTLVRMNCLLNLGAIPFPLFNCVNCRVRRI